MMQTVPNGLDDATKIAKVMVFVGIAAQHQTCALIAHHNAHWALSKGVAGAELAEAKAKEREQHMKTADEYLAKAAVLANQGAYSNIITDYQPPT